MNYFISQNLSSFICKKEIIKIVPTKKKKKIHFERFLLTSDLVQQFSNNSSPSTSGLTKTNTKSTLYNKVGLIHIAYSSGNWIRKRRRRNCISYKFIDYFFGSSFIYYLDSSLCSNSLNLLEFPLIRTECVTQLNKSLSACTHRPKEMYKQ